MDYKSMFSPKLIDLSVEATTEADVFQIVAAKLLEAGMVNEDYFDGITKREANFPTGLVTQHLNIALPHADPEFVKEAFVFICRLKSPVKCRQMGDNSEMEVKNLFFLGIKDGKNQVGLLQVFMNLFMDEEFVQQFLAIDCPEMMYQFFIQSIES